MASVRKRTWKTKKGVEKNAWVVSYMHKGKQHLKTFQTRRAAAAWRAEMQHEVKQGIHTPASTSTTVAAAGAAWLAQAETDGLEASTICQYRQHLKYHITPFIGDVKLAELAPADVIDFRNRLIREGRSHVMTKKVITSLGAILATAQASGRVARNVVSEQARQHRTRQRRLEKRHDKRLEVGIDLPTTEELRALLAAQGRWRPFVVTAIFTGLRASELRGLTWNDVELDKAVLHVRQRADRWKVIGAPKSNAGKRDVPLVPMVVNALREWKLTCPKGERGLVFPTGRGNVWALANLYRSLGPVQRELIGKAYGLHAFRHAAASLFIADGWSPKRVQVVMGHSDIGMTFNVYGHLFPAPNEQDELLRLQARLVG